jgi:membrane-bound serine protease (ClpP class)
MMGVLVGLSSVVGHPAAAQDGETTSTTAPSAASARDAGRVSVIKAEGLLDPVLVDFIDRSITDGEAAGVVAVVIQLDSPGATVDDARLTALARHMNRSSVPVTVWIGPSGSSAQGGAAQIAGAAERLGIAPGSRIGKTGELVIPERYLRPEFVEAGERLENGTVGPNEAYALGLTATRSAPVIGEFLIDLPGFETEEVQQDGRTVRQPVTTPVFSSLPVHEQLFHTVSSPAVAYLLLLIGLSLIVFEFFTAGVGVAGLVGAGSFVLSCYGLANLPVRGWALGLLVLALFGFSVDVQTGVPRVWSAIGAGALVIGSLFLYEGFTLSWITLLVGIVGTTLAMVGGMPAMVRTRFSTPTIGREWMIGEEGEAVTAVSPDGVVRVRGALWRARTNRATPIGVDDPIRVVEVDGLLLEVEPTEGGAVDYREKRRSSSTADDGDEGEGRVLVDGKPLDPA